MYKKYLSKIFIVMSVSMISSFTYAAGHLNSHNNINKTSPSHTNNPSHINKEKSLYVVISFKGNIYVSLLVYKISSQEVMFYIMLKI